MATAAPRGGSADDDRRKTGHRSSTTNAAAQVDLPGLRTRLVGARRRLVGRVALEYDPELPYPEPGLLRVLADVQAAIEAINAIDSEGEL